MVVLTSCFRYRIVSLVLITKLLALSVDASKASKAASIDLSMANDSTAGRTGGPAAKVPTIRATQSVLYKSSTRAGPESNVLVLPCWIDGLGRTGRINILRRNVTGGRVLHIQMNACFGSSVFSGNSLADMTDGLFINIRALNLRATEVLRFYSTRRQIQEAQMPFGAQKGDLAVALSPGNGFFAHLVRPDAENPSAKGGLRLQIDLHYEVFDAAHNLTTSSSDNPVQPDVVAVVDYVVTYRASDIYSAYKTASMFDKRPAFQMKYCRALGSFVPSDVCEFKLAETSEAAGCPSNSFQKFSNHSSLYFTGECWDPSLAQYFIQSYMPSPTYGPVFPLNWNPPPLSVPDDTDYYRNVGLGVGAGFVVLGLVCGILRSCFAAKERRKREARQGGLAMNNLSNTNQSPPGNNVRASGANSVQSSGRNNIETRNFIGAPPTYDEIFKSSGAPEAMPNRMPEPTAVVVSHPSSTSGPSPS